MGFKINSEKLSKIEYLQLGNLHGRSVPLFPYCHEDGTWELWLPDANDEMQKMKVTDMAEGKYFAKRQRRQSDIYSSFIDFMCKRAYWPDVAPFVEGIYDDLQNLSASLAKLDLFYLEWKRTNFDARRFVITELEYLFMVCRSLYDLLQECLCKLFPRFKFNDSKYGKRQLPLSFADMIYFNNVLMTPQEIATRYYLPEPIADYYTRQASFFQWLREYRIYVSHSGKSFEFVVSMEKGFAVSIETKPFSSMQIWNASNTQPHMLGSVKSLVAFMISQTFKAIEEFAPLMQTIIVFPNDVSPDNKIFICGPTTSKLQNLEKQISDEAWYD
jgi:hypothetical protein